MNRQFPCILKGFYTYFVFDKGSAIPLDENCIANIDEINFNDKVFKNITTEYLANTCGEVKSKEHAEFIVKLAEVNEIQSVNPWIEGLLFCFYYNSDGDLVLAFYPEKSAKSDGEKQITIPLPPEREGVDEWPKVNDTVSLRYRFDSKQVMYTGELLYLSGNHIIINTENGNDCHCIRSEWDIEKPKKPEQELEYNLTDLIMRARDADVDDVTIARSILSKYNITKKGEGDE